MTTKTSEQVIVGEAAQAEEKLAAGVQIFTFEDGIFEFSSVENYDKTDSDAQTLYENLLRVEYNSQTEYFATININHRKLPAFNANNKYKLRLVAKKDCFGKFRANDNRERTAEAGRIYIIDITNDYKFSYEHGSLLSLGLYHVNEDMCAEFFTSGEYTPMLIIAANGVSDEILNEGIIDLDSNSQLLVKHYYKSFGLLDGVTHMTDLFARNSIVTICSFPAEKSLINMDIQHVFRSGEKNTGYGTGFKLNLDEYIKNVNGKDYYCDALGNRYWIKGEGIIVRNIIYTAEVPATVKELYAYKNASIKPVKWIYSDNIIKGFGSDGNLIMLSDSCQNCIVINRAVGKISSIERYNGEQCTAQMNFSYNRTGGNLSQINFGGSEGVAFEYNGNGNLTLMTFTAGKTIYFYYDANGNISKIKSTEGYESVLEESGGKVKVSVKSTRTEIPDGRESSTLPEICSDEIEFKERTAIVSGEDYSEYYGFNEDGLITSYVREENSVVVQAEQYNETPNVSQKVVKCLKQALNKNSYRNFVFIEGETITVSYNENGQPKRAAVTNTPVKQGTFRNVVTKYNYGKNDVTGANLCKSKETEITYKTDNAENKYTVITTCEYDNTTNMLKKQTTYTDGEETAMGKSVEEYEYDKQGNCTKVTSYNDKMPETKFVTERTFDNYGRILSQKDETGSYSTGYGYKNNTKMLSEITYADGTGEEYGYNVDRLNSVAFKNGTGGKLTNEIEYTYGEVTKLTDGSNAINFKYDSERRMDKVTVGEQVIENIEFGEATIEGKAAEYVQIIYGTDAEYEISAAKDGSFMKLCSGSTEDYRAEFNADGSVSKEKDGVTGEEVTYTYDSFGMLLNVKTKKNGALTQNAEFKYDGFGKLTSAERVGGGCSFDGRSFNYTDDSLHRLYCESTQDKLKVTYDYDAVGRLKKKDIQAPTSGIVVDSQDFEYFKYPNSATNRPLRISYSDGERITYNYNGKGNITRIDTNNDIYEYVYDGFGRLKEEYNSKLRFRKEYEYDNYGNILKVTEYEPAENEHGNKVYAGEKSYVYENGRLKSYAGQQCVYDNIGNPTTYRGKSASWKGRQLTSYNGTTFTYDGRGRRISKGNKTFTYDYAGNLIKRSDGLEFVYDSQGVAGFRYNNNMYYYRKDAQGNIIAILDSSGNAVVHYYYDAWGNHTISGSVAFAALNPFRYRGYYYDSDTKLYFLQTRYYDPEVGRFLNMDKVQYADMSTVNGYNLYAYCNNNPVNYVDPSGTFVLSSFLIGLAIGAVIGAGVGAVSYVASETISYAVTGEWTWSWGMFGGSILGGAIGGALSFAIPGLGVVGSAAVTGGLSTAIGMGLENALGEANHSALDIAKNTFIAAALSATLAGITKMIKVPGFTGRGSISQVARQINTKLYNGTISNISAKTFTKLVAYNAAYSVFNTVALGIIDGLEFLMKKFNNLYPAQYPTYNNSMIPIFYRGK